MSVTKVSNTNVYFEPSEADELPVPAFLTANGVDGFDFATTATRDAAFVDVDGSGLYELLSLSDRLYMVDNGSGGITLATSGDPIAQLIDDGAGGYEISSDFTQPEAAVFYMAQDGSYWLATPQATEGMKMIASGSAISFFI
jgi:hypothetical protein